MFKNIINFIISIWNKIIKMFKKTKNTRKTKSKKYEYQYEYDNNDWKEVGVSTYTDEYQCTIEDEKDDVYQEVRDYYVMVSPTKVKIKLKDKCDLALPHNCCMTEQNKHVVLVRDAEKMCLYPKIKISDIVVNIYTGHTLTMIDNNSLINGYSINPQVYVSQKGKTTIPLPYFKRRQKAIIMTKTLAESKDIIIQTMPSCHINVMHMYRGRPKMATIALVFTLILDDDYVWSGSLIHYCKYAFIVSNKTHYKDSNVTKIVAFTIASHDIEIITE